MACDNRVIKDGYGTQIDRKSVCYDAQASVVVRVTDSCPCSYPGNYYSNKRWQVGRTPAVLGACACWSHRCGSACGLPSIVAGVTWAAHFAEKDSGSKTCLQCDMLHC